MKLRREPYLLLQKDIFSQGKNIQNIGIKKNDQYAIFQYSIFKKTLFYLCILSLILTGLVTVSAQFINEYSTYKNCQTKSGIWDKKNSTCGFLVIHGNNFEFRKVVLD